MEYDKVGTFSPSQVRDAGIQAVASGAANDGLFCVFESGCAAAALTLAFEYPFAFGVDITAAAAISSEVTLVSGRGDPVGCTVFGC